MRWNRPGVAARLAALSGAVTGRHDAPPNVSVVIGGGGGPVRQKHAVYVQGQHVASPATDGRLLRTVVRAGAALVADAAPDALIVRAVTVLAPDGSAVLVDHVLRSRLHRVQPRLAHRGYRLVEHDPVPVDPESGRLAFPDAAALWQLDRDRLDAEYPPRDADDHLGPVDAPVRRIVVASSGDPESRTAATAVAAAAGLLRDARGRLAPAQVARLARLRERAELVACRFGDEAALAALITGPSEH